MKTGKIGLRKFFYKQKILDIGNTECAYGEKEETVRHLLIKCWQFSKLRKIIWADEVRKTRFN